MSAVIVRLLFQFVLAAVLAGAAWAAGTADGPDAEVRLIGGGTTADGEVLAGVEISMAPGWKTYWRKPGDSGIPPQFDFSGSSNVARVEVEWPAPQVEFDGYGWVIGYEKEVVFPLRVTPQDPSEPVLLALDLDYAVCSDICVPMEAAARTDPTEDTGLAAVKAYLARVPEPLGEDDPRGEVTVKRVTQDGAPALAFVLRMNTGDGDPVLLIEGPQDWYLPVPQHAGVTRDGAHRFMMGLGGVPSDAELSGARLRVTAVSPAFSFERDVTLD